MRCLSTSRLKLLLALLSTAGTCALIVGCQRAETAPVRAATPQVTVQSPVSRVINDSDTFIGRTAAVETVEVRARVDGYLDEIAFEEGQEVEKGQLLFVIDPRPYEAALERSKSDVERYQAQLDLAAVELRRSETLLRKNVSSKEDYDKALATRDVSAAGLSAANAQVMQDQLNLDFTRVTAPISGRISRALVTKGNLVIGSVGNPTLLTTIVTQKPMYVYFDVDERRLLRYQEEARQGRIRGDSDPNQNLKAAEIPVSMALAPEEGYPHRGVLDFAENTVDPDTGTIQVRAVFPNEDRVLTPGLFARIRVESSRPYDALLIPEIAIGTDQGQKFVLLVNDKNEVVYRRVTLGTLTEDNYRVITEGLQPTDRVIVNGMLRVRPGMTVEPVVEEPPADAGESLAPIEVEPEIPTDTPAPDATPDPASPAATESSSPEAPTPTAGEGTR